ncbi:MAG TPA: hypothetical protein PLV92_03215 [Pirellulaceae bacterium]|nr:hypothetical protein [Pirellulaceae bacterium]
MGASVDRFEKFKNLLTMAAADGKLTEREIEFLSHRALQWGLTDHQFTEAVDSALRHQGEVSIPRSKAERLELLRDMIRMMAADGQLADVEKQLFATVAAVMKMRADDLDQMIDELLRSESVADPAPRITKSRRKS